MSKNITLTECNLANTCYNEDCEPIYPQTIADQVIITGNQTLTQFINNLNIPDAVTVESDYNEGMKVASVTSEETVTNIKIPYISQEGNTIKGGLPNFDWNYFKLGINEDYNKIQFSLNWDLINTFGTDTVAFGNILNASNDILTSVSMPKPTLTYNKNNVNESLDLSLKLGNNVQNTINIPYTDLKSLGKTYAISSDNVNHTITLTDSEGASSTIPYNDTTYTASKGITINNQNVVQHTNNIASGSVATQINEKGKLEVPTVNYDSNGHITTVTIDEIDIKETPNTEKLWISSSLSNHYFRIPVAWLNTLTEETVIYIPLFKIIKGSTTDPDFRVNQLFEIVSRLSYSYYGKYLLTYGDDTDTGNVPIYTKELLTINNVPTNTTSKVYSDIVAYVNEELIEEVNKKVITVYKRYTYAHRMINRTSDTFFVSILGENNPLYSTGGQQNTYKYYCTDKFGSDDTEIDTTYIKTDADNLGTLISIN